MRGRIMGSMAGSEAEVIAFGLRTGGYRDDRYQIALMAEDQNISIAYLKRLRPKVRAKLRRHWPKVERVAQELLAKKTLTAAEIDALVGQMMTPDERERVARIELARKPLRDQCALLGR
jgi:DNA-binding TFAR19-related protein (PDSD5 family)